MKSKPKRSHRSEPSFGSEAGPPKGTADRTIPAWRRWLYRGAALFLTPVLVFGVAEWVLRMAGRGVPATFLVPATTNGQRVLVENAGFGRMFFPSALARSPAPIRIAGRRPDGTFRVLLFGESAALGDPRLAYGMGRYLEVLLQERYAAPRFEVVPIAMTAINSHALRRMASEARRYDGDVWVIYAGNNEMVGPFGAATVFGPRAPNLAFVRASLAVKSTRTGQALAAMAESWSAGAGTHSPWTGLKMFQQSRLSPDHPGRLRVMTHFEQNLESILRSGHKAGVPIVLSTVAVNLKDCAPFASLHASTADSTTLEEFDRWQQTGRTHRSAGQWEAASVAFARAAALDPRYAEVQFLLGESLVQVGRLEEARAALEQACEGDALPVRATPSLNAIIRSVAGRHASERVTLVDSAAQLAALGEGGIPGRGLFFEHVHPSFQGNYLIARGLAEAVAALLPEDSRRRGGTNWASAESCDERLGLTDWNRAAVLETVLRRVSDAPYTNQLNSPTERAELRRQWVELRRGLTPDRQANADAIYREALSRRPNDFRLHENLAEFLEAVNRVPEAVSEWNAVREIIPHHFAAYANLGRLQNRAGSLGEARSNLEVARTLEPRSVEVRLELARVLARQGELPAAVTEYEAALRLQPGNARSHIQLADVLARQGRREAATDALRRAVAAEPGLWEAHYLLGVELAMTSALSEAKAEFETAVRLNSNHALSRLNLGVALIRLGKAPEAKRQFGEALRIDPQNEKAKRYLETVDALLQKGETAAPPEAFAN